MAEGQTRFQLYAFSFLYLKYNNPAVRVILTPEEQAWWRLSCPRFLAAGKENMNRYVDYRILADLGPWAPSGRLTFPWKAYLAEGLVFGFEPQLEERS